MRFQQVLLLVACLLTQLTFCVSALYMFSALDLFFFCWIYLFFLFLRRHRLTRVCRVQSRRSRPQLRLDFSTLYWKKKINWETKKKKKKHEKLLDSFGGLVLDCITTVSGVQSVIAECFLVYLCFTTSSKRKTSRVTFPPLQKQNVTIMQ